MKLTAWEVTLYSVNVRTPVQVRDGISKSRRIFFIPSWWNIQTNKLQPIQTNKQTTNNTNKQTTNKQTNKETNIPT